MARARKYPLPSIEALRERWDYNPVTGDFHLRARVVKSRCDERWNSLYAGIRAGCLQSAGYWFLSMGSTNLLAHRVAWAMTYGDWPEAELDHRDGNKLNNAIDNLRLASRSQNMHNKPTRSPTGYKGVQKHGNRFCAYISVDGKPKYLGSFYTPELAHEAYCKAAIERHGEFAHTGIIAHGTINATINIVLVRG